MKIEYFDQLVSLVNGVMWSGDTLILETDLGLVDDVGKELNINLLNVNTLEGKEGVLRHYIFELSEASNWYNGLRNKLHEFSFREGKDKLYIHINEHGISGDLGLEFSAQLKALEMFDWFVTDSLQLTCVKYKIDFKKLCSELGFNNEVEIHPLLMTNKEMIEHFDFEIDLAKKSGFQEQSEYILLLKESLDKLKETNPDEESTTEFVHIPTKSLQIAFLYELGILDFLKERYSITSTNKLSRLVSIITGIGTSTAQPAINSAMTENVNSHSYPLTSSNISKVKETLIGLGITEN